MADLTKAQVTITDAWSTGGVNGKRGKAIRARITGATAGSVANKLVASAFGLRKIENCTPIFLDAATKRVYPAVPAPDGTYIVVFNPDQATDANRTIPADITFSTDIGYLTVEGYE